MRLLKIATLCLLIISAPLSEDLAEPAQFTLRIKDHSFAPNELTVPAGQKIKLIIL